MYNSYYDSSDTFLLVTIIVILIALALAFYIMSSLIFYNTAKVNGPENLAFLGWIPIANTYLMFTFGSKKLTPEEIKNDAKNWIIAYIILWVISFIPILGFIASLATIVIAFYFMYRMIYRWSGDTTTSIIMLVLSIFTSGLAFYIYGLVKMKKPFIAR